MESRRPGLYDNMQDAPGTWKYSISIRVKLTFSFESIFLEMKSGSRTRQNGFVTDISLKERTIYGDLATHARGTAALEARRQALS